MEFSRLMRDWTLETHQQVVHFTYGVSNFTLEQTKRA